MAKKKTREEIRDIYESNGYSIIGDIPMASKVKCKCVDKNGYLYFTDYGIFLDKRYRGILDICGKSNPYTKENLENFIKINGGKSKVIHINKDNLRNEKIILTCSDCGEEYEKSYSHLIEHKKFACWSCSSSNGQKDNKIKIEDIRREFTQRGFIPLFDKYTSNKQRLDFEMEDGYRYSTILDNIKNDRYQGIQVFSTRNPFYYYNLRIFLKKNNLDCILIEQEKPNPKREKFKCSCGNEFTSNLDNVIFDLRHRCRKCTLSQSEIELRVETWLKENGVVFEMEYRFEDCRRKRALPFDFIIWINDTIRLIEVDGIFHYENAYGKNLLEKQKESDEIKNNYCRDKNIPLLRIPYWEFHDGTYKERLKSFTSTDLAIQ